MPGLFATEVFNDGRCFASARPAQAPPATVATPQGGARRGKRVGAGDEVFGLVNF